MDIVLYEGWRVGIDHPLYRRFNEAVDLLVCLEADIEASAVEARIFAPRRRVRGPRFRRGQADPHRPICGRCSSVPTWCCQHTTHSIRSLDRALIEKLERIADFRLQTSGGSCDGRPGGCARPRDGSSAPPARRGRLAVQAGLRPRHRRGLERHSTARAAETPFGCASGCSSRRFTPGRCKTPPSDRRDPWDGLCALAPCLPRNRLARRARAPRAAPAPNSVLRVMTEQGSCAPEHAHALALFAIVDSSGLAVVSADGPEAALAGEQAALRAKASVEAAVGGVRPDVLVMSATPGCEESVLRGVALVFPGVPVFGGSAADDGTFDKWFVVGTDSVLNGDGVLITAMFTSCHVAVSLASLHRPTEHRVLVTKLGANRTIAELDHVPAAERYNELTGGAIGRKLAELKSTTRRVGCTDRRLNIHLDSVLCPRRVSFDGDGTRHFQLIEPGAITRDLDDVRRGEGSRGTLPAAGAVRGRARRRRRGRRAGRRRLDGPAFGQALLIYCAGCFLALQPEHGHSRRAHRAWHAKARRQAAALCVWLHVWRAGADRQDGVHARQPHVQHLPVWRAEAAGAARRRRSPDRPSRLDGQVSSVACASSSSTPIGSTACRICSRSSTATKTRRSRRASRRHDFELSEEERAMLINDIDRDGDGEHLVA